MISFNDIALIELTNKNIIITGANSGIGFEAAKHFAKKKANVFLCSRSIKKGEQAKQEIVKEYPDALISVMTLDLADSRSIEQFAEEFKAMKVSIDILLNNAGIMAVPFDKTKDGYERQIGVNHLGHFYLTSLLLNNMTDFGRIVNVSSMAYLQGKVDMGNFMFENGSYSPFKSYARSKLANVLFTLELAKKLKEAKSNVVVVAAHPGVAKTSLFDKTKQSSMIAKFVRVFSGLVPTAFEGAKAIITASIDPNARPKDFYGPYKQRKNKGNLIQLETLNSVARDPKNQQFLWDFSIKQTKAKFPFKA